MAACALVWIKSLWLLFRGVNKRWSVCG